MTIRAYFEYLGIDGTAVLPEQPRTESYICSVFHLRKKNTKENESSEDYSFLTEHI